MIELIKATSIPDAWFQALYAIMEKGRRYLITKGSNETIHRAGLPVVINIEFPGARPLAPLMPEGSNIPPPTSQEDIDEYVVYIMDPTKASNEHYTYGEDLHWQIPWVIKHFKEGGFGNNHCYMSVGRPETVHFYDLDVDYDEAIIVKDRNSGKVVRTRYITNSWNKNPKNKPSSQCLRGIDCWVEDEKLHFWIYFRSWDHWGGFPVNLGGIQQVKEYMAEQIGVADGPMIVSCKDLHVYEHTWTVALMRLKKQAVY